MQIYDITPSRPPAARPLRAQIQIGQPVASADLDSERILVRDGLSLALLPGGRWPQQRVRPMSLSAARRLSHKVAHWTFIPTAMWIWRCWTRC